MGTVDRERLRPGEPEAPVSAEVEKESKEDKKDVVSIKNFNAPRFPTINTQGSWLSKLSTTLVGAYGGRRSIVKWLREVYKKTYAQLANPGTVE